MTTTHQASTSCPSCGSWYRNGDKCNICGTVIQEPEEKTTQFVRQNIGRQWSKSKHRYLTTKEIAEGQKGG